MTINDKYFYISKDYASRNGIWLYAESNVRIEDHISRFGNDSYEHIGPTIIHSPWYDEKTDSVIEMPENIKVVRGIRQLHDGEFIGDNNELIYVDRPSLKHTWCPITNTWLPPEIIYEMEEVI
ncbi:MAG: hypothetical protein ACRCX2_29655 [Paraclostridium sp.]